MHLINYLQKCIHLSSHLLNTYMKGLVYLCYHIVKIFFEDHFKSASSPYSTFPAFTLPLPLRKTLLDVLWMKPGRTVKRIIQLS